MDFLPISGCETIFKSELRRNQLRYRHIKLRMKSSALNLDFDGPSLDCLRSSKPVHEGIKEWYPVKVVILPLFSPPAPLATPLRILFLFLSVSSANSCEGYHAERSSDAI